MTSFYRQMLAIAVAALFSTGALAGKAPVSVQSGDCGTACSAFVPPPALAIGLSTGDIIVSLPGGNASGQIVISGKGARSNPQIVALNGQDVIIGGKTYTIIVA